MKRTATAGILACAMLLAVSIVSPAFGGPSIGSVAKSAKKALKASKTASRAAHSAKRTARDAKRVAATATSTANSALGKAGDGAGTITTVDGPNVSDGNSVASSRASCPAGTQLISGGHSTGIRDIPSVARMYGNSFYGVIVVNTQFEAAEVQAHATCSAASAAGTTARSAATDRRALAAFRADLRRIHAGMSFKNR